MIAPWYAILYNRLDKVAMRHGYALALHGSMARDLDLVAIPWTKDADEPEVLIKAFIKFITQNAKVAYRTPPPDTKPHGRLAYTLPIGHEGHYLDISVMPKLHMIRTLTRLN